jgi:hypothetical protein
MRYSILVPRFQFLVFRFRVPRFSFLAPRFQLLVFSYSSSSFAFLVLSSIPRRYCRSRFIRSCLFIFRPLAPLLSLLSLPFLDVLTFTSS